MPILTAQERLGLLVAQRFLIRDVLAEGGMGIVFRATDLREDTTVALKILRDHAEGAAASERGRREQSALTLLRHPNIVACFETGETDDGVGYLAMELVSGDTLLAWLAREGPVSATILLKLVLPLLGALAFAHRAGIVHRDVKPANVLLAPAPDGGFIPKLADFGLAKDLREGRVTRSGRTVGTPHYMAPEQVRGELSVGYAVDVWAMGVTCFEALTGRAPFAQETPGKVMIQVATERAPRLAEMPDVVARAGRALARAIDRALERELDARYRDAAEFARALLEAAIQDGTEVPDDPDPLGLPDYAALSAQAKLAQSPTVSSECLPCAASDPPLALSAPDGVTDEPAVRASPAQPPREQQGRRMNSLIAAVLVLGLAALTVASLWMREPPAPRESRPVSPATHAALPPPPSSPAPEAPTSPAQPNRRGPSPEPPSAPLPEERDPAASTTAKEQPPKSAAPHKLGPKRRVLPESVPSEERAIAPDRSVLRFEAQWR